MAQTGQEVAQEQACTGETIKLAVENQVNEDKKTVILAYLHCNGLEGQFSRFTAEQIESAINALDADEKKKLEDAAKLWVEKSKKNAVKMADTHETLALVGALVFGFSIISFQIISQPWYFEAIANDDREPAIAFAIVMAAACVLSALGLCTAIIRCWSLKRISVENPTKAEGFSVKYAAETVLLVHALIWSSVELFLGGLAIFSVIVLNDIQGPNSFLDMALVIVFGVGIGFSMTYLMICYVRYKWAKKKYDNLETAEQRKRGPAPTLEDNIYGHSGTSDWRRGLLRFLGVMFLLFLIALVVVIFYYAFCFTTCRV